MGSRDNTMREELDDALCRDFPNLYKDRHASMRETCMCWGFDVGEGWEPLIRRASEKLEALILALPEEARAKVCASQVKEKFGTLRFYMTSETPEMSAVIREAEKASGETCEKCGQPGELRSGGWWVTLCDPCLAERKAANKKLREEQKAMAEAAKKKP
jgi:hypothetical protein